MAEDESPPVYYQQSDWEMAQVGVLAGERSRDGSVHVTDETFNAASHLAALIVSVLGTALLISEASAAGAVYKIVSFSIYGFGLLFLFGASTLHHSVTAGTETDRLFRMLDYIAIYPLIAGTFTPLCLVFYHNTPAGWVFCMTVWAISLICMLGTASCFSKLPKWCSMTLYITLGWFGAAFAFWIVPAIGWDGFALFGLGGVIYTVGGYIYTTEQPNPIPGKFGFHEIWHVAVIAAAGCHWCVMYFYVLPR